MLRRTSEREKKCNIKVLQLSRKKSDEEEGAEDEQIEQGERDIESRKKHETMK
jgi:hypothetical protein